MRTAGVVMLVLAIGTGGLAAAHAGAVPRAAVGLGVVTVGLAAVGLGLVAGRQWARIAGLALAVLVVGGGVADYRGWASAVGIALGLVIGALLIWPARSSDGSGAPAERPTARTAA